MKKLSVLFLGLCISFVAMSQAVIEFESIEHDFGKIYEKDGDVFHDFKFTNVGDSALVISNVKATCGCTTPSWTRTPMEQGEGGKITVKYSTVNRPGSFTKVITVTTNGSEDNAKRLIIRGEVIPKEEEKR